LVGRGGEFSTGDGLCQHLAVGLSTGVENGAEQVGDLRVVPRLTEEFGNELPAAAREGVDGALE